MHLLKEADLKKMAEFIEKHAQKKRDLEDLKILNEKSNELNKEAEDVLSYQIHFLLKKLSRWMMRLRLH
jgi:hypothetical protein